MLFRKIVRAALRLIFKLRAENSAALSTPGPVLLVPNHISWLDWLFLGAWLEKDWKFVTSRATARTSWLHRKIMINRFTFPIDFNSPYEVRHLADFLGRGGRLVLFAEGRISATGSLMKFFEGTGFLLHRTRARVIVGVIRGADRLPWVRHPGWTRMGSPVSLHFSEPLRPPDLPQVSTAVARTRLTRWLRDQVVRLQFETEMAHGPSTLPQAIGAMAALRPRAVAVEDINRQPLTGQRFMIGARVLAAQWRQTLPADESRIAVLLPNVNAAPVVIASLWLAERVPAILNFSTGLPAMLHCLELASIKTVITSRAFLEKAKLDLRSFSAGGLRIVYLEEIRKGIGAGAKLKALLTQRFRPRSGLGLGDAGKDAVVLFTSGSEGTPKGVRLTHHNLLANIRQMLSVIDLEDRDRLFNALPVFHSFGLAIGTLLPLVRGVYVFLYPSPLHYRIIPTVVYDRACTIFLGTNTFLNGYARRSDPYDWHTVRYLFAGAEKVQEATAAVYARRFGLRVLEGYGATECSPCISVNTPFEPKFGSAGRVLPGIECRIEPVSDVKKGGRLLVRGPNVMRGYLNPEAHAEFEARGGWYDTGDIVDIDEDGFLHILGRLKRFAKVSGEMISLTAIEDAVAGAFPHYGPRCEVAVISREDPERGEVPVAVASDPRLALPEVQAAVRARGLSPLCQPRAIIHVAEIPKLGTGKVHHRELERLVREAPAVAAPADQQSS